MPQRPMDPALLMAQARTQAQEPRLAPGQAWHGLVEWHLPDLRLDLPLDLPLGLPHRHWSSVPQHPVSRP